MLSLIFDLDDTLYFQRAQFERAVEVSSLLEEKERMQELYTAFRQRSEVNYLLHDEGKLTLNENRVRRIQEAFSALDTSITEKQALEWQGIYEQEINNLQLDPLIAELLTECQANQVQLGIITNGPSEHQRHKIQVLGLDQWFLAPHIVVSGDSGISKPDRAIFQQLLDQLGRKTRKYYYIGDNYVNDIEGANHFGWQTIWLNCEGETKELEKRTQEVKSHEELVILIRQLIKNSSD